MSFSPFTFKFLLSEFWKAWFVFGLFFCFTIPTFSQGWLETFDFSSNDFGEMSIQTPDGGYFVVGHFGDGASAIEDGFLQKLDADGEQQWFKTFGGNEYDELNHIIPTADGNYVLFGETFNPADGGFNFYLIKITLQGDIIWTKTYGTPNFEKGIKVIETADNGFAMVGFQDTPGPNGLNHNFYMVKADENGEELWANTYGGDEVEDGYDLIEMADGGIVFVGATGSFGAGDTDFLAVKYSATGDFDWMKTYGGVGEEIAFSVVASPQGGLYIGGITNSFGAGDYDMFLIETDDQGNEVAAHTYGGLIGEWGTYLAVLDDALIVAGSTWSFGSTTHDIYLLKVNFDGSVIWSNIVGEDWIDGVKGVTVDSKGNILISGTELFQDPTPISNAFMVKANPEGQILTNHIVGKVFIDENESCDFQMTEKPLVRWVVVAEGENTYYDLSDENGNYHLVTDTGEYILTLIPPNDYWENCGNSMQITQTTLNDTIEVDFANQINIGCPYLEIDISTAYLTPCESNTYYVDYCNNGTQASAGEVTITLDEFLNLQTSSITPSQIDGQTIVFEVPSLEPGECGKFNFTTQLDCEALIGKTHSVTAEIEPQEICSPISGDWDGSKVTMEATCEADSMRIIIRNDGDDMDEPLNFLVVEDQIIARSESFKLIADDSVIVVVHPDGKTVYATAEQAFMHPGRSFPSIAIEGCGATGGNESLGFVTQYPEDDADFFRSIDCQESAENFAPQTRTYPKGVDTQAFIQPNRDIEYHVLFQNTTTDTLNHLAVRDTLSSFLDWTTLRSGASSHPYEVDFSNDGILKFTFENLQLPVDSFGFVKFRLSQKTNNPVESMVTNEPALSFDFNAPNMTNAVHQTVQNEFMFDIFDVNLCWSETFGGISYTEDAVLFTPVDYAAAELLTTTYIEVHPTYNLTVDTAIVMGEIINGIPIFSDTMLVDSLQTWMNCDSLITTQVSIITNTNNQVSTLQNLVIYPNPATDFLYIDYEFSILKNVNWTIYNKLGQEVLTGKSAQKIAINDLQSGIYYLKLKVGEEWVSRRFSKN